jgi:hypothetical protein
LLLTACEGPVEPVRSGVGPLDPAFALGHAFQDATLEVSVDATLSGVDTGFDLKDGLPITVTATGIANGGDADSDPDGLPASSFHADCLAPGEPIYGLVGKVGAGPWVFVGSGPTELSGAGRLQLALNDDVNAYDDNSGSFEATIHYTCQPGHGFGDDNFYHCGPPDGPPAEGTGRP